jgi:hypothetical protein
MNQLRINNPNVAVSRIGLRFTGKLNHQEWQEIAAGMGEVASAIAFIVGDWLVYGQSLFGLEGFPDNRVDEPSYQLAMAATGLDRSTLQNYAYVSRCIPYSLRSERLSWEHHRLLARLPEAEIGKWIARCEAEEDAGRKMSTRRLRKSLALGRVATAADMEPDESDKGIDNHIPFVNRLALWWRRRQQERFLASATREQRAALKRDLQPVVDIYNQL